MKKIKLHLLKLAMAPFASIVHFEAFISKFVKIPMLDKLAEWSYRVYWSIDDAYARTLGYKNSSDFTQAWLERNAILVEVNEAGHIVLPASERENDEYDDDWP